MKKILIPTDFSENAYNALKYGVKLFAEQECVFHLLYTYTPSLYNSEFMVYSNLSVDEIYRLQGFKSLTKVVRRIKRELPNEKHRFKKLASFNLLQDEIKNQVKTKGIDMVIMGTQGATGAGQILFGSHTVHSIRGAICPLLAVPANYEFTAPSNILFPTDFEPDIKEDHLKIVKDVAENYQSKIHILHIIKDVPLDLQQEKNKKALAQYLKDIPHRFHTTKSDTVPQGIFHFQEKNPIDLLVMVKHKHSFFYNLFFQPMVGKIGFRLHTPFLVIPVLKKETHNSGHEKDSAT